MEIKMNVGMNLALLALLSMSAVGFAADPQHSGAAAPAAAAQTPSAPDSTRGAPEEPEYFTTKEGKKLYLTGTQESRQLEAKKAIDDFAKSKGKSFDTLSEKEQLAITLQAVKEGNLSINALGSLFNDSAVLLLFANDADFLKQAKPEDRDKLVKAKPVAREILRAVAKKIDPSADWEKELAQLDQPNHFSDELAKGVADAIGDAIGKMAAGMVETTVKSMMKAVETGINAEMNMIVDLAKALNAPQPQTAEKK